MVPEGQPVASAIFTVGTSVRVGSGSLGLAPAFSGMVSRAVSPQPERARAAAEARRSGRTADNRRMAILRLA
jgi:hypothetical protein